MLGVLAAGLSAILTGCVPSSQNSLFSEVEAPLDGAWEIYYNPRYDFEFPYPSTWIAAPPPTNRDGQAFVDPRYSDVEIRGWANQRLNSAQTLPFEASPPVERPVSQNFVTNQGLAGELQVEIGPESSAMTLTLVQGNVTYRWQGRSPSHQFANYYQFFDYVARQYRVLGERGEE